MLFYKIKNYAIVISKIRQAVRPLKWSNLSFRFANCHVVHYQWLQCTQPKTTYRIMNETNEICMDTPGHTENSSFLGIVGCESFAVNCYLDNIPAIENCCKCKKECCGKCGDDWDSLTCGSQTLPPALTPGAPAPVAPSDETTCFCVRTKRVKNTYGGHTSVQENYVKTCPKDLFPSGDCEGCCKCVSSEEKAVIGIVAGVVAAVALAVLGFWCWQKKKNDASRPGTTTGATPDLATSKDEHIETAYEVKTASDSNPPAYAPGNEKIESVNVVTVPEPHVHATSSAPSTYSAPPTHVPQP